MSGRKGEKQSQKKVPLGFRPITIKKGYRPTQGNLDTSNPPRGGSGVPSNSLKDNGKADKKE